MTPYNSGKSVKTDIHPDNDAWCVNGLLDKHVSEVSRGAKKS